MTSDNIAIFGYGSLVNTDSLSQTLQRPSGKLMPAAVKGWVRDWSIVFSDKDGLIRYEPEENHGAFKYIRAINIRRAESPSCPAINGALIKVSESELAMLDSREKHYEKVDITKDVVVPHPFQAVYAYVGMRKYLGHDNAEARVPASYAKVIEEGFRSLGEDELRKYLQTTTPPKKKPLAFHD